MIGVSESKVMTANKGQALPSAKPKGQVAKVLLAYFQDFVFH